jgi:hypothetical protein
LVGREPLIEEPAQQEDRPDGEEGERPRDRAEGGQVVEEDLGEADREEGEAGDPNRAPSPLQPDVEERESE